MSKEPKRVHLVEIVRGNEFQVPNGFNSLREAGEHLIDAHYAQEEKIDLSITVPSFPFDGAYALKLAMEETFGIALHKADFFGRRRQFAVDVGPNGESVVVPWGSFELPGIEGSVSTGVDSQDGRLVFNINASVKRKHEQHIRDLAQRTREMLLTHSIYRGKAFEMRFTDRRGDLDQNPSPRFWDLPESVEVVFNVGLEHEIATSIFTPIWHTDAVRTNKIPLKRGVLLAGAYGTGKTLLAGQVAIEAMTNGWTFVYVKEAHELPYALRFVEQYQPAVVFVEDVDTAVGTNRDHTVDEILLSLDGVDNKNLEVMTILTTNHPENIHPALLRPGRVDLVLAIDPPDAEAVVRLLRLYGGPLIDDEEDLSGVGEVLEGEIAARVREVVERAKLEAINRTNGGREINIIAEDLMTSASTLLREKELITATDGEVDESFRNLQVLGNSIGEPIAEAITHSQNHGESSD